MSKRHVVKLGGHKRRYLDVVVPVEAIVMNADGTIEVDAEGDPVTTVDERTYKVPLMGSLKTGEMLLFRTEKGEEMSNLEATMRFHTLLSRYIPPEVVDGLDMADLDEFFGAWQEASADADGVDLGE